MGIRSAWYRLIALASALLAAGTGCSRYIWYPVSGAVKDASTGKPTAEVEVSG